MLNIVNEELMSYSTIVTEEKGKNYTKIKVASSNKLQQYENDQRHNNYNQRRDFNKNKNDLNSRIKSRNDVLKPINREIIRISAPLKNIDEFISKPNDSREVNFELPMSLYINSGNRNHPTVEVRCHEQGDDRANLYVVAFPFNGMIKPIPEDPRYRIYKGLIATSIKPFFYNNRKYRKVLYLVIEINKNLFKDDHKYHTNEIKIELESYALFDDQETNEKKTNYENFTLRIISPNGDYISSWDYDVINKPVMMNAEPGQPLWVTYEGSKKQVNTKRPSNNNNKKPVTIEGNMMVTTNKNGIRKEISMRKNNNRKPNKFHSYNDNRRYNNEDSKPSLDKMMMDSGMFDNDYDKRSKKNGGRNRNGNRGKNNRNYY